MAKKKSSHAAAAAAANGNGHHAAAPPPGKVEVYAAEERRDSSPERNRKAEQLKTLNSMLLKEAAERRGQVAALTARLDEISADDAALAAAESAVALAALAAPLRAAADEVSALRARLAAVQESLRIAEFKAALEAHAKDEANGCLEAATGENARLMKLLQEKEVEVASMFNKLSSLEGMVKELERNNSDMFSENGELTKQWGQMKEAFQVASRQKTELEEYLQDFKQAAEVYRVELEDKFQARIEELKVFVAKNVEMDARVACLEADLAAAMDEKGDLESEVAAKRKELDLVKSKNDKLQLEVMAAEKKYSASVAEVERLRMELSELVKAKEVAAKLFDAEKTKIMRALEATKSMMMEIQVDKEAAEEAAFEKGAQTGKLRTELEELNVSMLQLQASCNELDAKRLRLHKEKNSVQKALDIEKAEAGKLRLKIETLENCNGKMDNEIGELKVALEEKKGKIIVLTDEIELLQLAVAEAQKRKKGGIWAWLYCATTTMVAAISFIYATRSR